MTHSLVYLYFAILGHCLSSSPSGLQILPASLIGQTHIAAGKNHSSQGHTGESAQQASCRKFVGEFYAWYVANSKNSDPLRKAIKRKKVNFSSELVRRLNEDAAAAAKSPGEIVGLDFDPVLNSQDFAETYVPGKVTQKDRQFSVEVFSVYSGKKSDVPAVIPELRHEGGRWVFTNFIYKHDGKTDDLLSILRQLKADRKKGK